MRHKDRIVEIVQNNPGIKAAKVAKISGIRRAYVYALISELIEQGNLTRTGKVIGDKSKSFLLYTNQQTKCIKIQIKPDQAAMWLLKSKPHWETRWIPIVRSIGLGVRQSM